MAYRNTRSGRYKTFKHYLELPAEVRKVINDGMDVKDMCRFTRCSSLCNKEVKKSEKYIYGLTFDNSSEKNVTITVNHAHFYYQNDYKYQVVFRVDSNKKCMKYSIPTGRLWTELWKVDLDSSIDLVQLASAYFKNLLEFYQNSIKSLHITGEWNHNVEVRSLKNLRILDLSTCVGNIVEVISRRGKSLQCFSYSGEMNEILLGVEEFMCRVQFLYMVNVKLNIEQFRRLSAHNIRIHIGELTPNHIFEFITSWQNGQLRENLQCCSWELADSNFNVHRLWELLRLTPGDDPRRQQFRIEHNTEADKFATLEHFNYEFGNGVIQFEIFTIN